MKYDISIIQNSPEWWALKVGKVSGTRFGQLVSSRENNLLYECANEILNGFIFQNDFESEEMQFGNENEPISIDKYSAKIGLDFQRGGVIYSDFSKIHIASPDAVNVDNGIIIETKATMNGATQLRRFKNGIESDKIGQIVNYFAVSDSVNEVHWLSYCPFRPERELVVHIFNRNTVIKKERTKEFTVQDLVEKGREKLAVFQNELDMLILDFCEMN